MDDIRARLGAVVARGVRRQRDARRAARSIGGPLNRCASAAVRFARRLRSAYSRRAACLAVPLVGLLLLVLATWGLAHHIYFDRSGVPDIEPFIRFELSTIGKAYDARGTVLVELAREYRQVVSYEEVAPVLRHAITVAVRIGFDDNRTTGDKE